ncbi:hypothetical protein ACHAW6_005113 [Cyclotella cf. meneghiniana]
MIARHTLMPHPHLQRNAQASRPLLTLAGADNLVMLFWMGPIAWKSIQQMKHLVAPVKPRSLPQTPALLESLASVISHEIYISPTILTTQPFTMTTNLLSISPLPSPTKVQNISTTKPDN